jgi:hypothetical protein
LIARFGTLGIVHAPFLLRSDNGPVFTSRAFTRLVRGYSLRQEFITLHCPQQNGMIDASSEIGKSNAFIFIALKPNNTSRVSSESGSASITTGGSTRPSA